MPDILSSVIIPESEEYCFNFLKNPVFVFAGRICDEKEFLIPMHRHLSFTEIMYIASGKGAVTINNRKYTAKAGNIIIFNSGLPHEEFYSSHTSIDTIYCSVGNVVIENFNNLWVTPSDVEPVFDTLTYKDRIHTLMLELHEESCSRRAGFYRICNNLVENLIVLIIRAVNEKHKILNLSDTGLPAVLVKNVNDYINVNFSQKITLDDMARNFNVSLYHISHTYKQLTGSTPIQHLINRRIEEAKRLLVTTEMSIHDIAMRIGYENPNHFYLPFKKITGLTPNEYRKKEINSIRLS